MDYKYLWRILKYVLTTIVSILAALYVGYHLVNGFSSAVETTLVPYVNEDDIQMVDGYIMRSETLLYADGTGNFNYLFEDATKVSIGEVLAELYTSENSTDVSARLKAIDRRLSLLKNSSLGIGQTYTDTAGIDETINDYYYTILKQNALGNTATSMQKRDAFLANLNKRQIITGVIENFDSEIEELQKERDQIVKASGQAGQPIKASACGYYYADTDGYEQIFSAEKVDEMTLADFDEMIHSQPDDSLGFNEAGGQSAGKIVDEFTWYLACRMELADLRSYNLDTNYWVIFPSNGDERISMKLTRIVQESEENDVVLIFSSQKVPEDFSFLRRQTVQIVKQSASGLRVPISSVRMENDVQGVYVLDGYIIRFRPIVPLMEVDNYLIVSTTLPDESQRPLKENDAVVVGGQNLYDGKVVS